MKNSTFSVKRSTLLPKKSNFLVVKVSLFNQKVHFYKQKEPTQMKVRVQAFIPQIITYAAVEKGIELKGEQR